MPFSQGNNASPLIEAFIPWAHAEEITWIPPSSLGVPAFPPARLTPPEGLDDLGRWRLTDEELNGVLAESGFQEDQWPLVRAIVRAESGGRPYAFNGSKADLSYGILQINMKGSLGPARRKQYGLTSNDDLFDPVVNAKIAYAMSAGGKNWRPWGGFTNGSYKKYLE